MMAALPDVERRRLLEVRGLHPAVPVLVLHPLLTVVTGFGRDASDTVVECLGRLGAPLGPAVTGTVEIGGRILELPGALSDPDARPDVVRSPMIVSELGRRRAAHAAKDLSQRAARVSRREAGLARRDQLVDRLERLSSRADALERELHPDDGVDDDEIERLLIAARLPSPTEPNPIVTALLDEWEALVAERKANGGGPTVERAEANLEAIRTRIAERESATADGADTDVLSAEGIALVQECHAAVERLAASLEDGRRSERRAAGREVATALDAERAALTELGFDSYAAFLLAMAEGRAEDDGAHDTAALRTAEAALDRARDREAAFVLLSERELDLRTRVARLLGRLPGPDVGVELRVGRETIAVPSGAEARLASLLRGAGVPVGDDPVAAAERWLTVAASRREQRAALAAELAEIESEGSRLDEQLEQAELELAAAERDLIASVSGSLAGREAAPSLASAEPEEIAATLLSLVGPGGPPVVVGECFTELSPQSCTAVLEMLGELSHRRQVIIVTEHDQVGQWAQGLGIDGVVWGPAAVESAQRAIRAERTGTVAPGAAPNLGASTEAPEAVAVPGPQASSPEPPPAPTARTRAPALFDFDAVESAEPDTESRDLELIAEALEQSDAVDAILASGVVPEVAEVEALVVETPETDVAAPVVDAPPRSRAKQPSPPKAKAKPPAEPAAAKRAREPEPAPKPKPKAAKPKAAKPEPAPGPWKAQRQARRKAQEPEALPWEGRFDTSRQRELPSRRGPAIPPPPGTAPLAVCAVHRGVLTRTRCERCGLPTCDECLVKSRSRRKPVCVECGIIESGARARRRDI